jgi:glucose/arabinose dehydrogenase
MPRSGIAAVVAVALCLGAPTASQALPRGTRVRTYKGGLAFPVDMDWVHGTKKIFFTEKNTGKVRVMKGRRLLRRPCVNLDVSGRGERGALGIVLHPQFKRTHFLYVYYTKRNPLQNRVTRFKVRHNRCRRRKRIVGGLNASSSGYHNGGQLEFVNGKLFVSTGEAHNPGLAQDRNNRLGKILRYNPDGSIPRGNPFSTSGNRNPVWTRGHRNPFGLAHKPGTNKLYETENGPQCDDELNHIVRGRNYGWGAGYNCGTRGVGPNPKGPLFRWSNIVVPTDPVWYRGRLKSLSNRLYVGDFGAGRLHRFKLNRKGTDVRRHSVIHNGAGIVDVAKGPGGWLYMLTANAIKRIVRR